MEESLRKIEAVLREQKVRSRIEPLLPERISEAPAETSELGVTHYGKISTAMPGPEAQSQKPEEPIRPSQPPEPKDAVSRIGAGSRELSLEELSAQSTMPAETLGSQQLGGSRFYEINLDDLSSSGEGGQGEKKQ
jgi:hypothetical protein